MFLRCLPRIKEVDIDGRLWRIDLLGAIRKSSASENEPTIDVVISPLKGKSEDPTKTQAVFHRGRKVVQVGVGHLPVLRMCSVWKHGEACALDSFKYKEVTLTDLIINSETRKVVTAGYSENGDALINPQYYDFGGLRKDSKCLAISSYPGIHYVIFPMSEIIRFYYATSSELSKKLFWGEVIGPHSWISKSTRDRAFVEGRNLKVKLEQPLEYPSELHTIARIIGSDIAEKGARMIHDSIVRNSASSLEAFPETIFPFEGVTTITCSAKLIAQNKDKGLWNLIVLWIKSCTGSFPYDHIVLDDDGDCVLYDEVSVNKSFRRSSGGNRPTITVRNKVYKKGMLRSDVESNTHLSQNFVLLTEDRFPALKDSKIYATEREYKREESFIIQNVFSHNGKDVADFTTAIGVLGTDAIRHLSIGTTAQAPNTGNRQVRKAALPASFSSFVASLNFIKKENPGTFDFQLIQATTIPGDSFMTEYGISNYFPEEINGKRLSWVYVELNARTRRQVLVARVLFMTRVLYLLEAQHNKSKGDWFTILLLHKIDYSQLSEKELEEVLAKNASNKGSWFDVGNRKKKKNTKKKIIEPPPFPMFKGDKVKHSSENVEILGLRILGKVKLACGIAESLSAEIK